MTLRFSAAPPRYGPRDQDELRRTLELNDMQAMDTAVGAHDRATTAQSSADAANAAAAAAQAAADQAAAQAAQAITDAAGAQATADGKVTTYFQAAAPAAASEGDLWVDTANGNRLHRWTNGVWTDVQDAGISQAIAAAADAQSTADGKIVTFFQTTTPTAAAVGDLWVDTDDNNHPYRWNGAAWVDMRDGTIAIAQSAADAAQSAADAAQASADQAIANASTAQATADGKVTTFFQTTPPTAEGVGDLWVDTDDSNHLYRWDGSTWVSVKDAGIQQAIDAASVAQDTADGKIVTFYQTDPPAASAVGDLWVETDNGNRLYRWDGTAWVDVHDTGVAFMESFESVPRWNVRTGSGVLSVVRGDGETGGSVLLANGYVWQAFPNNLQFDPNRLYRLRCRVRLTVAPTDPTRDNFYCGVEGVAADGVTLVNSVGQNTSSSQHYVAAQARDMGTAAALGTFVEFIGWFKGHGTYIPNASDPLNPSGLHADVRYIRPLFIMNYTDGDGQMELDYIAIDVFDEDAHHRIYSAVDASGNTLNVGGRDATMTLSQIDQAIAAAATAQSTADGKIQTFYQTGAPASAGVGDLWIDTDDSNKLYRFDGTTWVLSRDTGIAQAITDAATAQATADGKVTTFYAPSTSPPTAEGVGDLWYQTNTTTLYRWNGTGWQAVSDITGNHTAFDTARVNGLDALIIAGKVAGTQVNPNPEFANGSLSNYHVYDNNNTGLVTLTAEADDTAPNRTGYKMHIARAAGTGTSPNLGGYDLGYPLAAGALTTGTYRKGSTIIHRILAKIPVGYNINFETNAYGTGGTYTWLTSTAGTGAWTWYIAKQVVGTTGTFAQTGYWSLSGSTTPVDWYVAVQDWLDITSAVTIFETSIVVPNLAAISADIGTIGAGVLQDKLSSPSAAIRLDSASALPAVDNYVDLAAAGAAPFLKHGAVELRGDGTAVIDGRPPQMLASSVGRNILENADFEIAPVVGSGDLAAGWYVEANDDAALLVPTWENQPLQAFSGTHEVYVSTVANKSVPANTTRHCTFTSRRLAAARPNEWFRWRMRYTAQQNAAIPAGLSAAIRVWARVEYSDGSFLDTPGVSTSAIVYPHQELTEAFQVPAAAQGVTVTGVRVWFWVQVQNTTGAAINTPNGLMWDVRFDAAELIPLTSLADDTTGGPQFDDDGTIWVPGSTTINVGTRGAPGTITKTLRIPYTALVAQQNNFQWKYDDQGVGSADTALAGNFRGLLVMPRGVTMTAIRIRGYRTATTNTWVFQLLKSPDSGGSTSLTGTITHPSTGWVTIPGVLNDLVDGSGTYILWFECDKNLNARLLWVEIDYQVPNYSSSY